MANLGIAYLPTPGTKGDKPGKPKPRQLPLRAVSSRRTEDHSLIHDWVQSQLRKLGDIIHVLDHGGVLLDKDQAVIARRALVDACAYRSEMLAAAPDSDMIRRRYSALFNQMSDTKS